VHEKIKTLKKEDSQVGRSNPSSFRDWFSARGLKGKPLVRRNLAYLLWRYAGNASRTLRAHSRRCICPDTQNIAGKLLEQGVVVAPSTQFLTGEGVNALAEASELVLGVARSDEVRAAIASGISDRDKKGFLVELIKWEQEHNLDSPLMRVALDRKLLEIISLYLGMWPRLHAIGAWLNFPTDDEAKESQLWHRDGDDLKIVKAFVYLNDVDEENGPFSYVPKTQPFGAKAGIMPNQRNPGRVTDDEMREAIPTEAWLSCTGPAQTMILADTTGYHRGGKPVRGNRILLTYTYTSGTPFKTRKYSIHRGSGIPAWMVEDIQVQAL
jgi:hypothetical protein